MTDVQPNVQISDTPQPPDQQPMPEIEVEDVPRAATQALLDKTAGSKIDKSELSGNTMMGPSAVKQTTDIPRRLLQKTKTEKNNYLGLNNRFDAVGTNGLFSACPSMVKFAGFELRKTHTLKVKMINNSPAP